MHCQMLHSKIQNTMVRKTGCKRIRRQDCCINNTNTTMFVKAAASSTKKARSFYRPGHGADGNWVDESRVPSFVKMHTLTITIWTNSPEGRGQRCHSCNGFWTITRYLPKNKWYEAKEESYGGRCELDYRGCPRQDLSLHRFPWNIDFGGEWHHQGCWKVDVGGGPWRTIIIGMREKNNDGYKRNSVLNVLHCGFEGRCGSDYECYRP